MDNERKVVSLTAHKEKKLQPSLLEDLRRVSAELNQCEQELAAALKTAETLGSRLQATSDLKAMALITELQQVLSPARLDLLKDLLDKIIFRHGLRVY